MSIIKYLENPEKIANDLERFSADAAYVDANHLRLKKEFKDKWIAVYQQEVISAHEELGDLLNHIKKTGKDPARVYIECMQERPVLILNKRAA